MNATPARLATLAAVGIFALQLAWSLTVTPFRGIDEFDHVYRAEQVASGQILSRDVARDGRGLFVTAKGATVRAAGPVCRWVGYTGPDNCRAVRDVGGGYVIVASAAAGYAPFYYAYLGLAAKPFAGYGSVYAQRVASGLANVLLLWMGLYALAAAFRTAWPLAGALTVLTPTLVYSSMLGQPNGPEITAAFSTAACLVALGVRQAPQLERRLLLFATVGAVCMALTRMLSPEWLVLDLLVIGVYLGRARLRELWHTWRGHLIAGGLLAAAACVVTLVWNRVSAVGESVAKFHDSALASTLTSMVVWPFQTFAAFPLRQDFAPPAVYALGAAAIGVSLASLVLTGALTRRWVAWFVGLNALWVGVSFGIQWLAYPLTGAIWQGRYALPFAVVVPLLLFGWADRAGVRGPSAWVAPTIALLMGTAEVFSVVHVHASELAVGPVSDGISGPVGPAWLAVVIAALGALAIVGVAASRSTSEKAPAGGPAGDISQSPRLWSVRRP